MIVLRPVNGGDTVANTAALPNAKNYFCSIIWRSKPSLCNIIRPCYSAGRLLRPLRDGSRFDVSTWCAMDMGKEIKLQPVNRHCSVRCRFPTYYNKFVEIFIGSKDRRITLWQPAQHKPWAPYPSYTSWWCDWRNDCQPGKVAQEQSISHFWHKKSNPGCIAANGIAFPPLYALRNMPRSIMVKRSRA